MQELQADVKNTLHSEALRSTSALSGADFSIINLLSLSIAGKGDTEIGWKIALSFKIYNLRLKEGIVFVWKTAADLCSSLMVFNIGGYYNVSEWY